MRNLINFIQKNSHWLLFIILIALSVVLLIHNNEFQRSKYLAVFREVAGRVYSVSNSVESYMNLKSTNADILKRMSALEQEALGYRRTIELLNDSLREKGITFATNEDVHYRIMPARVVNNSVNKEDNYITLNKGSLDGFKPDMGVFTPKGVVGVIMSVSPHFSIVIPVLHHKYHLSCKIKDSNYFGSLTWEGGDPENTLLTGLPSHATFNPGDTILTNGYSPVFPEGIPVGVVEGALNRKTGENKSLKVKLFTDFSKLSEVMVIENIFKDEQLNLEKGVQK